MNRQQKRYMERHQSKPGHEIPVSTLLEIYGNIQDSPSAKYVGINCAESTARLNVGYILENPTRKWDATNHPFKEFLEENRETVFELLGGKLKDVYQLAQDGMLTDKRFQIHILDLIMVEVSDFAQKQLNQRLQLKHRFHLF